MSYEIGVDIVEVERIRQAMAKDGERFLIRLFSDWEQDYCGSKSDPAQHYAVRFAAKEALVKAFGGNLEEDGWRWPEVEVRNDERGKPTIHLHGRAASRRKELGASEIKLSLSHSREQAIAFVIVEMGGR
jgi:holo-[acyl-carrier protein] synthase